MDDGHRQQRRPLRADAERNRRSILCAADALFASEGTAVSLERIAAEAGVGLGTIYRRFPTIEALVAAVFEEKMAMYADRTEAAAEDARDHPWEALESWVLYFLDQQAKNLAFSDALLSPQHGTQLFQRHVRRAFDASEILVERVRAAGVVRPDFDHTDLRLLQLANAGIARNARSSAPAASRRFGAYMLEAFRAENHGGHLPPPPTAWTRARRAR